MDTIDKIKEVVKKEHPDLYWRWVREEHVKHHGYHYNEEMALYDVSRMYHTENGIKMQGEVISMHEAKMIRHRHSIPPQVTDCDLYVAINATYHDKKKLFSEWFSEEELPGKLEEEMYYTYLHDEDAGEGVIWKWINAVMYG